MNWRMPYWEEVALWIIALVLGSLGLYNIYINFEIGNYPPVVLSGLFLFFLYRALKRS